MKKLQWILLALGAAAILSAAFMLGLMVRYDRSTADPGALKHVSIEGMYSEEGGPWQLLTEETDFTNLTPRDITVRGHFDTDIPKGQHLFFIVDNIWLSLRVNGEEIYRIGKEPGDPNPTQTGGKLWVGLVSPGITKEDTIEFQFGNVYWNGYYIQFRELLGEIRTGSERAMLQEAVVREGELFLFGAVFLLVGVVAIFAALAMVILRTRGGLSFLWLALAAMSTGIWFVTLSPALALIIPFPVTIHILYSLSVQGMAICVFMLIAGAVSHWRKATALFCVGAALITVLISVVLQLMGIQDVYDAINYFMVVDVLCVICILPCLVYEALRLKSPESVGFVRAVLPLLGFGVIEVVNAFIQFSEASIFLGLGLLAFLLVEGWNLLQRMKRVRDNERRALALENELTQSRIATMLSQIEPHFLYNALNCIGELCAIDPPRAEQAVTEFSMFLRGNLDSLSAPGTISFERELAHTMHYLELEQMRFDERLRVVYQIGPSIFRVPSLTLQPIAENAVRHGVTKREEGGTVTISTTETDSAWLIIVEDDGVGFDPQVILSDERSHVGMQNVRQRLAGQCGGGLDITSTPGVGTKAVISIPKETVEMRAAPLVMT